MQIRREVKFVHSKKAQVEEKSNKMRFFHPALFKNGGISQEKIVFYEFLLPFCGPELFNIP